jgi:protein-S-isoprenylcysteine O-methyltransferase Ste14
MKRNAEEASSLAGSVFRWRSYLPLVAVAGLCLGLWWGRAAPALTVRACVVGGLLLCALGLGVRLYAVGHAPPGTSGRHRSQHAAILSTFGIYSVLRHPLYLGNVLVWAGASLTSGWPAGAAVSLVMGIVMFLAIARHEDGFLSERFGEEFREWARVTPAFFPKPALWRPTRRPFLWQRAVASEYSTLHSIGLLALIFSALRGAAKGGTAPDRAWWCLFALNSGLYLVLRLWRARRKERLEA